MTDPEIETLLRKNPRLTTPAGLLEKLQRDITLPTVKASPEHSAGWLFVLRRWIPAAACMVVSVAVIAMQSNTTARLRHENEALRAATQNLEQLRRDNAEYQRLQGERQELDRLRKDNLELQALRAEVTQLRSQLQEIGRLRVENQQLLSAAQQPVQPPANQDFFVQAADDGRAKAQSIMCINNLKQIGLAARIWATDNSDVLPPNWLSMSNELSTPKILVCPADAARTPAPNWAAFSAANVSYDFLNPNGSEAEPQVVLARCPIHNHVCLSDGSVQQLGKNRSIILKDGKYYMAEPSQPAVDAEALMRKRYGLPEKQPAPNAPPANPALSEELMRRYGLIPAHTNAPPKK
jgi:hypothetical protein